MHSRIPPPDDFPPDDWDGTDWSEELYDPELRDAYRPGQGLERASDQHPHLGGSPATDDEGYAIGWWRRSSDFRQKHDYRCQICRADLSQRKELLHTHHNNRDKTANDENNLMALCALCHASMEGHGHMLDRISKSDREYIEAHRPLGNKRSENEI